MNTDIQIYTHHTPLLEFRQLGYLYPNGEYKQSGGTEWFTYCETLAVDAIGIDLSTDQTHVDIEKYWFLAE